MDNQTKEQKPVTIDQQIKCIERELALRERFFANRVKGGTMKPEDADREKRHMQAALTTLQTVKAIANSDLVKQVLTLLDPPKKAEKPKAVQPELMAS